MDNNPIKEEKAKNKSLESSIEKNSEEDSFRSDNFSNASQGYNSSNSMLKKHGRISLNSSISSRKSLFGKANNSL